MDLEDDDPVLRGGMPNSERWHESILDALDIEGRPLLSVNAANRQDGESDIDVCTRIALEGDIKHGKVVAATAGMIRKFGCSLEHDDSNGQAPNHFHIVFTDEPTTVDIRELINVFSDPFPNPAKARNY